MVTDILVVGAGPAGLGASIEAARAGARVLVVDENHAAGGQLYKQIHKFFGSGAHYAGSRGFQIADILLKEATELGVTIWLNSRALGLLDSGAVAVQKEGHIVDVSAKKIILATGAKENGLAFEGWTLPGVITAGCAQTFSNVHRELVGRKVVIIGSGNVGLIVGYQLMQSGAHIQALIEIQPQISGYLVHANKLKRAQVPIYLSHTVIKAMGDGCAQAVEIARVDEAYQPITGTERHIEADTVLIATGLSPRAEIASMFHCQMTYESRLGGLLPLHNRFMETTADGVYICGDLSGVEEASTALDEGRLAGLHAAMTAGFSCEDTVERIDCLQQSLDALRQGEHGLPRFACKTRIFAKGGTACGCK